MDKALELALTIKERYGARPYGFHFFTKERGEEDLDSKVTKVSGNYYIGGQILTLQQVIDRKDPSDSILIWNMKNNNIAKIVVNTNSYRWTQPLGEKDIVINPTTVKPKLRKILWEG